MFAGVSTTGGGLCNRKQAGKTKTKTEAGAFSARGFQVERRASEARKEKGGGNCASPCHTSTSLQCILGCKLDRDAELVNEVSYTGVG